MEPFADEDQEPDLPPSWVVSSLRPACGVHFCFSASSPSSVALVLLGGSRAISPWISTMQFQGQTAHTARNTLEASVSRKAKLSRAPSCPVQNPARLRPSTGEGRDEGVCSFVLCLQTSPGHVLFCRRWNSKIALPFPLQFQRLLVISGSLLYARPTTNNFPIHYLNLFFFLNFKKLLVGMASEHSLNSRLLLMIHQH